MPTAVAVFFAKAAVAAGVTGAAIKAIAFVGYTLGAIGTSIALQKVSELLLGKPKVPRRAQDVEYNGTVEPRRIIYGKMRVSGLNVIPPLTSGNKNKFLHQVLAIAGHEVSNITTVFFNQESIGTISSITGSDNDGKVTTGTYANKAWVRRYKGTDTQTSDYKLNTAFSQWTPDHRGRGVAYLALTYEFDTKVFTTGRPAVTCLVEGKKVYDPRKDSTQTAIGGSGSHRYDDFSTFEYSTNPALCLADYLMSARVGLGEEPTRIDWATVANAADICDENVSIPDGAGGTTTQKRYTCNCVLVATDNFADNIEILAQAMMGACFYSGGQWRIRAGAFSASAFTLTDDDLIENGIDVVTALPFNEKYNAVRGRFINASQNYQLLEFPPVINSVYSNIDGGTFYREIEWPSTTNVYEAQRNATLVVRQSRNNQKATVRCGMSAWKIRPFDTGTVTFSEIGWTNKTVRCESWKFDPKGFVELVLREDTATAWGDPSTDGNDYEAGQFPAGEYFIPLDSITLASPQSLGYADTYFNDPSLDAVEFNLVLGGDNTAWTNTALPAYYSLGLPRTQTAPQFKFNGATIDLSGAFLTQNRIDFSNNYAITNPSLFSVYSDADQYDDGVSPIIGRGPGAQTNTYPGMATLISGAITKCKVFGSPVYVEAFFDSNPSKTTSKFFSNYTHFSQMGRLLFFHNGAAGYVARFVYGMVDKDADPATLTTADINYGLIYTGNSGGGTIHSCLNGVSTKSSTYLVAVKNFDTNSATQESYASDAYTQNAYSLTASLTGVASFSKPVGVDAINTFKVKFVAYLDFVANGGAGTDCGRMEVLIPRMFTHPGWDFDYQDPIDVNNPTPGINTPDEPTGLQALGDQGGIQFSWQAPATFEPGSVYQLFEYTASTPFSSSTKIWEGQTTSTFIFKFDTTTRYYWVRVQDQAGNFSATEPPSIGVPAAATSVSTTLYAYANTSTVSKTQDAATITTDAVTVTAVSGTATYTYAWTKLSGDSITATSASAASTTFSASTMLSGQTRTAIFRCTVTDSASPQATFTVDIAVSISRPAMSATASPGALYKFGALSTQTTASTTVTVSGGTSSYNYSWARVSGGYFTINSPSSATTTFTATNVPVNGFITGVYRCTVTDSSSPQKVATADVYITFERESLLDKF